MRYKMKKEKAFDILVVGGGHAGLEAAHIAAQFGMDVGLVTMPGVPIGSAPCNPSIGGVGKAQVVREIDYLGGLMGKLADRASIHYKTLNESRGYAVRSTRTQIDKQEYEKVAEEELNRRENILIVRECVERIEKGSSSSSFAFHIITENSSYSAKKVIVTTGTFLAGKLHIGKEQRAGGRMGHGAAKGLENIFEKVETLPVKFKTGTPPRIARKSINFNSLKEQPSDSQSRTFHWKNDRKARHLPQLSCFVTYTNAQTLKIIRDNKGRSPLFNGQIKGVGPRYCPSIEDKAYRYLDRDIHHIFLEPEGLQLESVYPSGISTSLPKDIQLDFLQTIRGLENCEVLSFGHAVEYDVVNTGKLSLGLEYKGSPGLYFAGQINGTSGYEEAASQGLIAGINACYSLQEREIFQIARNDSYIGVLIDDLVGQKRDEPYRLFTARNENRLYVREDNTFLRMAKYRRDLGLKGQLDEHLENLMKEYDNLKDLVSKHVFKQKTYREYFEEEIFKYLPSEGTKFDTLIKNAKENPVNVLHGTLKNGGLSFQDEVIETVAIGEIYQGYIARSERQLRQQRKLDKIYLNMNFLLNSHNISFECKQRIKEKAPETFGQLRKIEGIRPATLAYVSSRL